MIMDASLITPSFNVEAEIGDFKNLRSRTGLAAWLGCVATLGLIGNSLVILAVVLFPKLRTITNIFITSLAVSDMLVCLIVPWIIVGIVSTRGWPLPAETCVLVAIMRFTLTGSSIWHLVVIGFNRMILITTSPERYQKIFSRTNTALFLMSTWLIPFSVIVVPYAAGVTMLGYDEGPHLCSDLEDRPDGRVNLTHGLLSATFLSCIPLAITLSLYLRIFIFIKLHMKRQKKWATPSPQPLVGTVPTSPQPLVGDVANRSPSPVPSDATAACNPNRASGSGVTSRQHMADDGSTIPGEVPAISMNVASGTGITRLNDASRRRHQDLETRITKNTFLVVVALIVCLIPYGIFILTEIGPDGTPMALSTLILSTCLNPLIYGTKHPQFRAAIRNILARKFSTNTTYSSNSVVPTQ